MSDGITTRNEASKSPSERAHHALEAAKEWSKEATGWSKDKAQVVRRKAKDSPKGTVAAVGAVAIVAAGVFGIGEVLAAGAVAFAAYEIAKRRRGRKAHRNEKHDGHHHEERKGASHHAKRRSAR